MNTSSTIKRRTRLSPEARHEQLMHCAIDVFAQRGIARAGHAEIADTALVSVATVFNYFSTREELVNNVLERIETFFLEMVEQSFKDDTLSAKQAIHHYLDAFIEAAINKPAFTYIWLEWSSSIREDSWPRYLLLLDKMINCIKTKLQPAFQSGEIDGYLSPDEFARSLCNQGYMILQLVNQPQAMEKAAILDFMTKYINSAFGKL